ncbi:MAG: pilin [Parcubacteria group bacterium]|nr:pilin [Parcubacteria group bacterium]MCR4343068.1 pilin [Patescibacteria group bacterium]
MNILKTKKSLTGFIHKIKKTLLPKQIFWSIISLALFLPFFVYSDEVGVTTGSGGSSSLKNPLAVDSVSALVKAVAEIVMKIGFMVAVVFIIYSGFLYVSARGSEEKLKKAHSTFTWTIIGTAVILGAWTIAMVIESTVKSLK